MKQKLGDFALLNRHTGKFEDASLYDGMDQSNIDHFYNQWVPAFDERRKNLKTDSDLEKANMQDWRWEWGGKAKAIEDRLDYQAFSVELDGTTQGLMIAELTRRQSRIESQKGLELIYVELLATAPWNRPGFSPEPKYKGIGRLLIAAAVNASIDLGFKGRLGLRSLPQAETWYRDVIKMTDLGTIETPGRYFEMTESQAQDFLK